MGLYKLLKLIQRILQNIFTFLLRPQRCLPTPHAIPTPLNKTPELLAFKFCTALIVVVLLEFEEFSGLDLVKDLSEVDLPV